MLAVLLPSRCGACGRPGPSPCASCTPALILPARSGPPPVPLSGLWALLAYDGPARPLVAGVKVRHNRAAVRWLGEGLSLLMPPEVDLVTWAPTSPARVARRGVDHAHLLALAVGRAGGRRVAATLVRRPGPAQTGRGRGARLATPPSFTPTHDLAGRVVAVVDDVSTTGATLAAAGRALVQAGAAAVHGLAAASTPRRRGD